MLKLAAMMEFGDEDSENGDELAETKLEELET